MPDVWTSNPEHLRTFLSELGATCGVESRVLKPRDPEWTCTYDSKGWLRDVYIHPYYDLIGNYVFVFLLICTLLIGLTAGLIIGKRVGT